MRTTKFYLLLITLSYFLNGFSQFNDVVPFSTTAGPFGCNTFNAWDNCFRDNVRDHVLVRNNNDFFRLGHLHSGTYGSPAGTWASIGQSNVGERFGGCNYYGLKVNVATDNSFFGMRKGGFGVLRNDLPDNDNGDDDGVAVVGWGNNITGDDRNGPSDLMFEYHDFCNFINNRIVTRMQANGYVGIGGLELDQITAMLHVNLSTLPAGSTSLNNGIRFQGLVQSNADQRVLTSDLNGNIHFRPFPNLAPNPVNDVCGNFNLKANNIVKWNANNSSDIRCSEIWEMDDLCGHVGVGFNNPVVKLHVFQDNNICPNDEMFRVENNSTSTTTRYAGAAIGEGQSLNQGNIERFLRIRKYRPNAVNGVNPGTGLQFNPFTYLPSANLSTVYADRNSGGLLIGTEAGNNGTNKDLYFSTNSLDRARITQNGNFGIGTPNPTAALHVNAAITNANSGGIRFQNLQNSNQTNVLVVDNQGNVSINNSLSSSNVVGAENGCSVNQDDNVVLGNDVGQTQAQLFSDREIPMNDNDIYLTYPTNPTWEDNRMGIGTITPDASLSIVKPNITNLPNPLSSLADGVSIALSSTNETNSSNNLITSIAIKGEANGCNEFNYGGIFYGGDGQTNIGVWGMGESKINCLNQNQRVSIGGFFQGKHNFPVPGQDQEIGVLGEANPSPSSANTSWAGYFIGDVFSSSGNFLGSDIKLKKNISKIENAIDVVSKISGYSYFFNTDKFSTLSLPSSKQYGIIAQEIESVLPSLIKETYLPIGDGKFDFETKIKSVNYTALIPILLESVKELKNEIDIKESKIEKLMDLMESYDLKLKEICELGCDKVDLSYSSKQKNQLFQNIPNPFSNSTIIPYNLEPNFKNAHIIISDEQGKLLHKFELDNTNKLEVNKSFLNAGKFIYSMFVDGIFIESKLLVVID